MTTHAGICVEDVPKDTNHFWGPPILTNTHTSHFAL